MASSEPVLRARILGCGSSGGVPRLDGDWGDCDPNEPKNRRQRCSLLLERAETHEALHEGVATRALIDTSPDPRHQWLEAGSSSLDGVIYTHAHADQLHGIDDLRALVYRRRAKLPSFANPAVASEIVSRFSYIFETPPGSGYPPLMTMSAVEPGASVHIDGPGGVLTLSLFDVEHGGAPCSGVRCGPMSYTPDVNGLGDAAFDALSRTSVWIVDALREKPHPTHAHLDQSLEWLGAVAPKLGVLTNLHIDLDYRSLLKRLPHGIRPAYDGFAVTAGWDSGEILDVSAP
ncbi:MBL fold metallo-hydrolase [Maricaulaceae bacterium EIL42A08]|nr:MBL fold metallo-hydrolase [Maricaulaceae bacterium EIL42A08]